MVRIKRILYAVCALVVLFADVACRVETGSNLIVYGHHMLDGTMFNDLVRFKDPDFCRTNPEIAFYTRTATRYYRPVAVMMISVPEARNFPYYTYAQLPDSAAYRAFFEGCAPYALWMAEELPDWPNRLLTLSTCEYSRRDSRLVVICGCVREVASPMEPSDPQA